MNIVAAYREVGTYRGAAALTGVTHKTVARVVADAQARASGQAPERVARGHNFDAVEDVVAAKIAKLDGRVSAKRLLPVAEAAGYEGSARNFRRLVARLKDEHRQGQTRARGRRPAVWAPGDVLVIDWGEDKIEGRKVKVFNAVLAHSRYRFTRYAKDESAATTMAFLAECFEELGGVPATVLADRMGCLKSGVVANVVVPTSDYVRFATHYGFRPDFCQAADPQSKGIVERLVGYAKTDLGDMVRLLDDPWANGFAGLNEHAKAWCAEVNAQPHSEIAAIPAERLAGTDGHPGERSLLGPLPSLRAQIGPKPITRKVDKLSTIRFASARYSVPNDLLGATVTVLVDETDKKLRVIVPLTGEIRAEHDLVAPGQSSIIDAHYGSARPAKPARAARARTEAEKAFLALGPVAEEFLKGAAAAGVPRLQSELADINSLAVAHGTEPVQAALKRAVAFGRWRADDIRSILATNGAAPTPKQPGRALVMTLPTVPQRSLADYAIAGTLW